MCTHWLGSPRWKAAGSKLPAERDIAVLADRVRKHFDDGCFACGRSNPIGLGVDGFRLEGETLIADFMPNSHHRGGPGILHGGVTAAALDEILAWAGMVTQKIVVVTATLDIRYRKPVAIDGRPLTLHGRVVDRHGRKVKLAGSLLADGVEAATATGLYVATHELAELLGEPV